MGESQIRLCFGVHVDEFAVALAGGEPHAAGGCGEERVVVAAAYVGAGMELGAALAHDDGAGRYNRATEHLHAEHLWVGVASVSR